MTSPRLGERDALAVQHAHLELDRARAEHGRERPRVLGDRLVEAVLVEQRLGAREDRLGPCPLVGGDAALRGTSASTPSRSASHSTVSAVGLRLAALDLRDVLLREAVAGELALGQAGRRRAAGAGARRAAGCAGAPEVQSAVVLAVMTGRRAMRTHSFADTSLGCNAHFRTSPKRGIDRAIFGQVPHVIIT